MKYKLGDICQSISETSDLEISELVYPINTSDVFQGKIINNIKSIEIKQLKGQFKKTFKKNDILYSEIRPINQHYALIDFERTENFLSSTKLMVIRVNKDIILPKYLYIFLTSGSIINQLQKEAETRSGTFPQITFGANIAPLEIEVPSIHYQAKVIKFLTSIDKKIEINEKINKNLYSLASQIFETEIVNISPLPQDWKIDSLLNSAEFLNGLAMQKFPPKNSKDILPIVKIRELRLGHTDSQSDLCAQSINDKYIVNKGDLLFSWSGTLMVDFWFGEKAGLNQHLYKITSEKYDLWFIYFWLIHYLKSFQDIAKNKATTLGHIKRENLEKAKIWVPDLQSMKLISNKIHPLFNLFLINRSEIQNLIELKNFLLPKLLSGEIEL